MTSTCREAAALLSGSCREQSGNCERRPKMGPLGLLAPALTQGSNPMASQERGRPMLMLLPLPIVSMRIAILMFSICPRW